MCSRLRFTIAAVVLACAPGSLSGARAADQDAKIRQLVDEAVKPVIAQYDIPGMAVAVSVNGERFFIDYGVAEKDTQAAVTRDTLFELGSISKTFTATLAAYAEVEGKLALGDKVGKHMPELQGSALGDVRLLDLATHTAGGFPLQLPDTVKTQKQLIAYYRQWKPQFAAATTRTYANPSIGLLGMATAKAMGASFPALMEKWLLPELGLRRTYVNVPAAQTKSYAWGYNRNDKPVRVTPALLAEEAYGIKSNAVDMIRFIEANMGVGKVPDDVARALEATHTGYFRAGELIQDLIWEQYPYPVDLAKIVAGNAPSMLQPIPATAIEPPMAPRADVVLNKTGSTNGFGAYVAYVPSRKIGIVMLANKAYPNEARVRAAYQVLSRLTD
ncbi:MULTISPECIES: class C beta-lactamase [unclassified Mesorhizobium]|uniref:class C beta-lactamase n=1 Tax=unclassified Mesorhizobium TaxID=325217 RepID=UPI002416B0A3|nr:MULTISPECIES: class C beta-lactamase [unclassified Mesorhizobium]MDG4901163.1 beta-lactamase [Mesorhizobium sp. WSM4962]MDG4916599.1 beta-lactamase [Mesorhizobium sp. WSM4989]